MQLVLEQEIERVEELRAYENQVYRDGFHYVAGLDEVGRGCIAGPVATAAVILPPGYFLAGVNDSKQLSPKKRRRLAAEIKQESVAWAVAMLSSTYIDRHNILNATREAMRMAIQHLRPRPDFLLIDAVHISDINIRQQSIIKGDCLSISIACASIIAKVERDKFMEACDLLYPGYGLAKHKGYGTREHKLAIQKLGPSPIHRESFEPLKSMLGGSHGIQPGLFK